MVISEAICQSAHSFEVSFLFINEDFLEKYDHFLENVVI